MRTLAGDDPTPWRHQVIEIPPLQPVVTEYQWHQLACPACGENHACALAGRGLQRHLRPTGASHSGVV